MNWKSLWQSLAEDHRAAVATQRPYRGVLRMLRPRALDRHAAGEYAANEVANPLMRRFPRAEQTRIRAEIRSEMEAIRRAAAAVARFHARTVRAVVTRGRDAIARARRDVGLSMPAALDHVDANGMIMLALLRTQLLPMLREAGPAELLAVYQSALERKDARGFVEAEIIEGLIATGERRARDEGEVSIVKQLCEIVMAVADLRVPLDVPDFAALAADADRLDARADALQIIPLDPEANLSAAQAYAHLLADMTAAGAASDEDDHKALRDELAS